MRGVVNSLRLFGLAACGEIYAVSSPNATAVSGALGTHGDIATGGRANDLGLGGGGGGGRS